MENNSNEFENNENINEIETKEEESQLDIAKNLEMNSNEENTTVNTNVNSEMKNNDDKCVVEEENTNSESHRSETDPNRTNVNESHIDQEESEINTQNSELVVDELQESNEHEETLNQDDEIIAASLSEVFTDVKDILEELPETTEKFINNILFDIIETVYEKCNINLSVDEEINDFEHKDLHEFEGIEEVNEPDEQEEEYTLHMEVNENKFNEYLEESEKGEIYHEEEEEEEKEEEEEEEKEEEEDLIETIPRLTREELISELKNASAEKITLFEKNTSFQHKLGDYLRRKKTEQPAAPALDTKDLTDFDQKYEKLMESLNELVDKYEIDCEQFKDSIEELKSKTLLNEDRVKEEKEKFKNYRFSIAQKSVNTRTGKSISQKEMEDINAMEEKKENVVVEIRLESIKLQNEVNKNDGILKSKEELADGLHLIDFEQFKIENQSYNEKLEERTEDLLKLRKKITSNVHVLSHVKEKLEFVKSECEIEGKALQIIDIKLNESRDNLTALKQSRDKLRISNDKMKRSSGMLGNRDLLKNYEDCVDTVEVQIKKMNDMKNKQLQLSLRNQALQMKIENTRKESSAH